MAYLGYKRLMATAMVFTAMAQGVLAGDTVQYDQMVPQSTFSFMSPQTLNPMANLGIQNNYNPSAIMGASLGQSLIGGQLNIGDMIKGLAVGIIQQKIGTMMGTAVPGMTMPTMTAGMTTPGLTTPGLTMPGSTTGGLDFNSMLQGFMTGMMQQAMGGIQAPSSQQQMSYNPLTGQYTSTQPMTQYNPLTGQYTSTQPTTQTTYNPLTGQYTTTTTSNSPYGNLGTPTNTGSIGGSSDTGTQTASNDGTTTDNTSDTGPVVKPDAPVKKGSINYVSGEYDALKAIDAKKKDPESELVVDDSFKDPDTGKWDSNYVAAYRKTLTTQKLKDEFDALVKDSETTTAASS